MSFNFLFLTTFIIVSYILITQINYYVYEPYMDEEFHFDQTESYIMNKYSYWNKKLTTFPGLFYTSAWLYRVFNRMDIAGALLNQLRSFNVIYGILFAYLLTKFKFFNTERNNKIFTATLALLPISYFYNFLYYTDTLSNLLVAFYFYLNFKCESSDALKFGVGAFAVLVRQNNIIWINFFALEYFISEFIINFDLRHFDRKITNILEKFGYLIAIDLLFIAFLYLNNFSLVLGDKSSHEFSFHLAQINHFLFFILFFLPYLNTKIFKLFNKEFYRGKLMKFIFTFLIILITMLVFNRFSYTHDFLLADNRHYSFYYFKRIYSNLLIRYLMITWTSLIMSLILIENKQLLSDLNIVSFFICLFLVLVPAKLFEFRYLTLGYILLLTLIHVNSPKWKDVYNLIFNKYNLIWNLLINALVMYVFVKRPFTISHTFVNTIGRFMW